MNENLEKRILVVDDDADRIKLANQKFGDKVELVCAVKDPRYSSIERMIKYGVPVQGAYSEEDIEQILSEKQYGVILMDGNLGLGIGGQYFDGGVISERLRNGHYGSLNQDVPIINTSSHYDNPFAESIFILDSSLGGKPFSSDEQFAEIMAKYTE